METPKASELGSGTRQNAPVSGPRAFDLAVIGGGPVGLATAWECAQAGLSTAVIDAAPGSGASYAAAGMLAPVTEAHFGEEELLRLNLASASLYPEFVARLEEASGESVGYRACGTLSVAFDAGDRSVLTDLVDFHRRLGLDAEPVTGRDTRDLEPLLAPGVIAGVLVSGDHQVDPRRMVSGLIRACGHAGVCFIDEHADSLDTRHGKVEGVRLRSGERIAAESVVVAAGCWSSPLVSGALGTLASPVRPVKGQILTLRRPADGRLPEPVVHHNLRCIVEGRYAYLVPRTDGRIVLGATAEERGFDTSVTVEAVHDLLRAARLVIPAVAEMEIAESIAGLRPGSPDNAPLIGASDVDGLAVGTGHYRNGILLTPITAQALTSLITSGTMSPLLEAFSPLRFDRSVATSARG